MTSISWSVKGQYYETCSCDFVCPCLPAQMAVKPTKESCTFAMAFQIERGSYGAVSLDGLGFIVLGFTPEAMGVYLDNTGHPAADRFALAHAVKGHVNALGLSWDDTSGNNNGQYAPFVWKSA
jgi:hypothetical protein